MWSAANETGGAAWIGLGINLVSYIAAMPVSERERLLIEYQYHDRVTGAGDLGLALIATGAVFELLQIISQIGYPGILVLMALESTMVPIPSWLKISARSASLRVPSRRWTRATPLRQARAALRTQKERLGLALEAVAAGQRRFEVDRRLSSDRRHVRRADAHPVLRRELPLAAIRRRVIVEGTLTRELPW